MGLRKVGNVDVFLDAEGLVQSIQLAGRSLYLTSDPGLLRKQFRGENLDPVPPVTELYNHVSTDAIIKANPDCYYYDDRLGTLLLRSLGGGGIVEPGDIRNGGFGMLFAGEGWGEGSSREVAAVGLLYAGIGMAYDASVAPVHAAVRPGDSGFIQVDAGFSHDYTTAPAAALIRSALGREPSMKNPDSIHTFPDHLTLAGSLPGVTSEALAGIRDLREGQKRLARETGIHFHATASGGSTGICHTVIREQIAMPGQVILGTDSHTCSAGALNCLAYGIGNTEIACIWEHNEVAGRVPRTVRIRLTGKLRQSCTAKDVILHLAQHGKSTGAFTGKVMEFTGPGLEEFSFEEQAVLSNMAVECNALTAIMEPTESMIRYLLERRGLERNAFQRMLVYADPNSEVDQLIELDLGSVQTLVAAPGHPGNGLPLENVLGTRLDLAYAGSCTAGDITSITMYAEVLRGRRVAIPTFIQYGSERVREEAKRRGLHQALLAAGVHLIEEPGCGACIDAGPGGPQKGQVAISATNRNMPGRMGEGEAYLANPYVVAASAVRGFICGPEHLSAILADA